MANRHFWDEIRTLAQMDDSVETPEAVLRQTFSVFQPQDPDPARLFRLIPMPTGVRAVGAVMRQQYEAPGGYFLETEFSDDGEGLLFSGHVDGMDSAQVFLYGDELILETSLEQGSFEFKGIDPGVYAVVFSGDEEHFWIPELRVQGRIESD